MLAASVAPQLSSAACPTVGHKMAYLLKTVPTHQVSVLAHRGLWGRYAPDESTPENSRASLQAADDACMDAVELDVKTTREGVPIIMHDFNLGRTTDVFNFFRNGTKYNPISNTGTNPAVSSVSWQDIQRMHLLTPSRNLTTGYFVPDVEGVLNYWVQNGLNTPIIFDTKTADAVRAINRVAEGHFSSPQQVVAVKVNATLYPTYRAFRADAPSILGIPVFTTNMLTKIDVPAARANWEASASALEINVKQKNGLLQGQLDSIQRAGKASGVFNAIPDGPRSDEFSSNDGHCCYRLSDLYFSYSGGKDTADNRGDWSYLVSQGYTFITTDDPRGLIGFLHSRGLH
ncbi:glycerophosphodiester phosphodiesterase family protein [Paraburkholderia caledonica]